MELHAVDLARIVGDGGERRAGRGGDHLEALGDGGDAVAVAHPDGFQLADPGQALEQRALLADGQFGATELTGVAALDLAAQHVAQQLLAVADAQHGHAQVEQLRPDAGAVGLQHAGRTARQDDGAGGVGVDDLLGLVERMDLAIDAGLAHPARDQLGHLAAEIDDQNALVMGFGSHV